MYGNNCTLEVDLEEQPSYPKNKDTLLVPISFFCDELKKEIFILSLFWSSWRNEQRNAKRTGTESLHLVC